jgi:hypothetical protein
LKADKNDLGKQITLSDIGVFHITRQMVIEHPNYYAIAITILPTGTPTTDTPMLTFPKQLATCVLPITAGLSASGITYASNNNQMFYRLHTGTVNNTTELIINGIIPKA